MQNRLGDETYGIYFALFSFCYLFQVLLDLGIQNYNSRRIAQNRQLVTEEFPYVLGSKLILMVLFFILVTVVGLFIGYPADYLPMILGIGMILFLQILYVYIRSHFSALGHYKKESWLSALDKLLMIIVLGYCLYVASDISIEIFIRGQILALSISCLVGLVLLSRLFRINIKFSVEKTRKIIKQSLPFALVILLMTLYTRMDSVMLERLLDDNGKAAGVYATGFRLLDAANIMGYLFAMLLLPMFARLLSEKEAVYPLLKSSLGLLFSFATIITALSLLLAPDILNLIYDDISQDNVIVFRLLMVSFWFMSIAYIYGSLITASGELRSFNMLLLAGIACNWLLNLWLIPQYQAAGAAIATLITQAFVCIGQIILASARHKLKHEPAFLLKLLSFMGITFAALYTLSIFKPMNWYIQGVLLLLILVIASFSMGIFRLKWIQS